MAINCTPRNGWSVFCRTLFCQLAGLYFVLCLPALAIGQTRLQYRYTPGEVLQYELKQTLKTSANIAGQAMENTLAQQLQLATRIDQVRPDGSAEMTKRIVRIQMQSTQPGQAAPLEYDSNSSVAVPGPLGMIVNTMADLVNQNIQMVVDVHGETSEIQLPEQLEKNYLQADGGIAGVKTPEGIKKMISQGSVIFPARPIAVNDAWTRQLTTDLPFGTMTSNVDLTYAGLTKEGLHRINAVSRISLTPKPGTPFEVVVKEADGRGIYLFDADRGCIYASVLRQSMNLEMSALGQIVQQNVVTDITLRLIEPETTRTATRPQ